jgi:hypothetical protein
MPKISVDGIEFNTEDLTDTGRSQVDSLQFLELQLEKIQKQLRVYQTAQKSYIEYLKQDISKNNIKPISEQEKGLEK